MSNYGVISGPYFPIFGLNTEKYGPEITPYLDISDAMKKPLSEMFVRVMKKLQKETTKNH